MSEIKKHLIDILAATSTVIIGLMILMAVFPDLFCTFDPLQINMQEKLQGISAAHILGTDEFGRDLFSRIVYGARASMGIGLGTAFLSMLIGVPLGIIAGYFEGITDNIIMRIIDAFQAFPMMISAILLSVFIKPSVGTLIITISAVSFPGYARLVRGQVQSIKKSDYIAVSKISGVSIGYMFTRVILPNCMSVIIVEFSMVTATAILIEAGLSFLGLGIQPPAPSWGSMLGSAKEFIGSSLCYIFAPTFVLFFTILSINVLSNRLRDMLDPKKKR